MTRRWNGWFNEQSVAWIERSQEFLGRLVSADRAEQIRGSDFASYRGTLLSTRGGIVLREQSRAGR